MPPLSPKIPFSGLGTRAILCVKRALAPSHPMDPLFTIEIVSQGFPVTIVDVVTTRSLDSEAARTLVRYIWKCKADPRVVVRAVDARGKERYRYDAAGAWTLEPEQAVIRLVPVGLRRSIHRLPSPSA